MFGAVRWIARFPILKIPLFVYRNRIPEFSGETEVDSTVRDADLQYNRHTFAGKIGLGSIWQAQGNVWDTIGTRRVAGP